MQQNANNNNFQNQRIILKQMSAKGTELFVLESGKLKKKDFSCQTQQCSRVARYSHTVRGEPQQYHIDAIKQYKKQLDQMRRNYYELQKAYWHLLGYRGETDQSLHIPYISSFKQRTQLCVTEVSEDNQPSGRLNRSSFEFNDIVTQTQQHRKKGSELSESIIQFNTNLPYILKTPNQHVHKSGSSNGKIKTEGDQGLEEQLIEALKEVQDLKNALQQSSFNAQIQMRDIKLSYEEHIKKLEQILERQRKHTKMLNGVINRLRAEIQSKDKLIKSVMGLKSTDKNTIQKLMRQLKVSIC